MKEAEEWRVEREVRMQERREKEDREREEAFRQSLVDHPPLEPFADDGQIPGTSGTRGNREVTPPLIPMYEESEPSDYEDESKGPIGDQPSLDRPEYGEDGTPKGKTGKGSGRKKASTEASKQTMPDTPIVELMNKEEKKLWQLRYGAADAIMKGLDWRRRVMQME